MVACTASFPCISGNLDGSELHTHAACTQPWDVGHELRLSLAEIDPMKFTAELLAQGPRQVVVPSNECKALVQRARPFEQTRLFL
jgi:hypothetical protein